MKAWAVIHGDACYEGFIEGENVDESLLGHKVPKNVLLRAYQEWLNNPVNGWHYKDLGGSTIFFYDHKYEPPPKKELKNQWKVGEWVKTKHGYSGCIKSIAPPGKPNFVLQYNKEGSTITLVKSSISGKTNPGEFSGMQARYAPVHGKRGRAFDVNESDSRWGRHLADED